MQQQYIPWVLDGIAALILITCILKSARMGFVNTLMRFIGFIAASVAAFLLSWPAAQAIFQHLVRPGVLNIVENALSEAINGGSFAINVAKAFESLPAMLQNVLAASGIDPVEILGQTISGSISEIARTITDTVIAGSLTLLIRCVVFFVIFALALYLVRLISGVFKGINHIPLVGTANRVFGGVLGAVVGIAVLMMLAIFYDAIAALTGNSTVWFSTSTISETFLFKYFFLSNQSIAGIRFLA